VDLTRLDATIGIVISLFYIVYHRYFKTPFDSAAAPYVIRSLLAIIFSYLIFVVSTTMWFFLDWPVDLQLK
jgi:hypothetical protein